MKVLRKLKTYQRLCIAFGAISALVWSVVPLLRKSLPMDTQEAIVWGKYCLWGTTKHPPLSGWLAYAVYQLFGGHDFGLYLLSQISVLIGLVGIYKLARCFLPNPQAVLATVFQMGIAFYHFSATEFNVNVLSLAIWPWCAYYFWKAYINNKSKDWILCGILMGINLLNKYVGGVLGIALLVFILPQIKQFIKNKKAYLALLACFIVVLPHLIWLIQNNFEVFEYIASRNPSGKIKSAWRYIAYPLKFLAAQILYILPPVAVFCFFARKERKMKLEKAQNQSRFLLCLGIVPTLFWIVKAAFSGAPLKDMWNYPSLFACGMIVFYFIPRDWTQKAAARFVRVLFALSMIFAFGYAILCVATTSPRFQSPCKNIANHFVDLYKKENTNRPLYYVAGNVWFSDMISLYADVEDIKPMIWVDPAFNPWFDEEDFNHAGALVIAESEKEYSKYAKKYGDKLTPPERFKITYKNLFGQERNVPVLWGIYQGE